MPWLRPDKETPALYFALPETILVKTGRLIPDQTILKPILGFYQIHHIIQDTRPHLSSLHHWMQEGILGHWVEKLCQRRHTRCRKPAPVNWFRFSMLTFMCCSVPPRTWADHLLHTICCLLSVRVCFLFIVIALGLPWPKSIISPIWEIQGGFFLTGSGLKVLSAGDGKIPNKKVKVRVCHREYVKF